MLDQPPEVVPAVEAAVVAVVEVQLEGVAAGLGDVLEADELLADLKGFLAAAVAAHLGGGGEDPQVLHRQPITLAVFVAELQLLGLAVVVHSGGDGGCHPRVASEQYEPRAVLAIRSEERRVGKECRAGWW